ncbi:MAG: DASS family sodium-coupled anion symporter [Sphingomonadaceae bacterium]|nr:DASS family sodium-coupled anion symporter [Sphingomonadaceae bacterium]
MAFAFKFEPPRLRLTGGRRLRGIRYFVQDKRWLIVALLLGLALFVAPTPDGLTQDGKVVLIMSAVAVVLFIAEPIPLPAVALMIIVGQVLLIPKLDSSTVARSLMNDSVLFIMGSLMLAVAIVRQKLDKRLAFLIVRITGTKTRNVAIGIATASGVLASFVGEHTVAAMMLPVALTLINLLSDDPKAVRNLSAILLFSIAYGCAIAGIGTPSGGARNAIMIGYWREFFFDPADPATAKYSVDYARWMLFCYPLFLAQIPLLIAILFFTFRPEQDDMARAVVRLREQIAQEGSLSGSHWATMIIFAATLLGWIFLSGTLGLGTIALMGAVTFLALGLVRWDDLNSGVNWGVVLLYGAAISLGVQMKDTGAAEWVAATFVNALPEFMEHGTGLFAAVSVLTTLVTNSMSNGAAVAVLGPISLNMASASGESPLTLGLVTAVSSAFAYLTVVGTPACTIVYASGYLKTTDFLKVGYKMAIMSTSVLLLFATFYWPLLEG